MELDWLQVILLALLQGVTELFPVSSLGHAVIVPAALLWPFDPKGVGMLPFLVILHVGTATALLIFYWREWWNLLLGLLGAGDPAERPKFRKLLVMLVIATIPAAILGAAANAWLRERFAVPGLAAMLLIVNGIVLFFGDRRHRMRTAGGETGNGLETLNAWDALIIGLAQCAALVPGISRSGLTIVAGLGRKLSSDAAAHFSFLMATPIIGGAALLEIPKLLHRIHEGKVDSNYLTMSIVGGIVAGIAAFASVAFLTRYFRATEVKMMRPFAIYCAVAGVAAMALFVSRG